jgi:hypothetical protein
MTRAEAAARARAAKAAKAGSLEERFWSKVDKRGADECWPWMAAVRRQDEGYGAFWFEGRHVPASRMAYTLTHGEPLAGHEVCHTCDNPPCCNPNHLFAASHIVNNNDKIAKDRDAACERHANAKLTNDQVREIRAIRRSVSGRTNRDHPASYLRLAERFGVTPQYIGEIVRNETRKRG